MLMTPDTYAKSTKTKASPYAATPSKPTSKASTRPSTAQQHTAATTQVLPSGPSQAALAADPSAMHQEYSQNWGEAGQDPNAMAGGQYYDPNGALIQADYGQQAYDPNAAPVAYDPNMPYDPNAPPMAYDPNAPPPMAYDPNMPMDPNAPQMAYDPNQPMGAMDPAYMQSGNMQYDPNFVPPANGAEFYPEGGAYAYDANGMLVPPAGMEGMNGMPMDPYAGAPEDDIHAQATDILAGLTSLGISKELRSRVQEALELLDQASASASVVVPELQKQLQQQEDRKGKEKASKMDKASSEMIKELEKKLSMSRSIMRKLYRKNVDLEKECQMLKTNDRPVTDLQLTPQLRSAPSRPGTAQTASGGHNPVSQAIQDRDRTIQQLQSALDAARRRAQLLEAQAAQGGASNGGGAATHAQQQGIAEVLAQSALYLNKYKGIREDYNRLLKKKATTITSSKQATAEAKELVNEMQDRLNKEIQEREAEAALYSSKLFESEKLQSDWYAEKRILEQQIERLSGEVSQRDRMDSEMEACVCDLFEKLKVVEEANKQMRGKLEAAGISTAGLADLPPTPVMPKTTTSRPK